MIFSGITFLSNNILKTLLIDSLITTLIMQLFLCIKSNSKINQMKKSNNLKWALILLFGSLFNVASAKNIFLSIGGSDSNNGLSVTTALASFSKAQSMASKGDTIQVSGMIDISIDPKNNPENPGISINKSISIKGKSQQSDGFDGKGLSRIFLLNNSSVTVSLKNLKFANGKINHPAGGGAIFLNGALLVGENLIFENNISSSVENNASGSAIQVVASKGITIKNSLFQNNTSNKSATVHFFDLVNSNVDVRFEGCAFIGNTCQGKLGGSAVFIRCGTESLSNSFTFVNCTMAKNKVEAGVDGGTFYLYNAPASTTVNLVNCTITENTTIGSAGNGAGIRLYTTEAGQFKGLLNIRNCVVEGNYSKKNEQITYSDFSETNFPVNGGILKISNSIIGRNAGMTIPEECISASRFNYLNNASSNANLISGFSLFNAKTNSYSLIPTSPAINFGDAQFLKSLNVTTDQNGNTRNPAKGKCVAGAVELIVKP